MQTNDPSAVTHHNGGTTFTGDAIHLYRAVTLKGALKLHRDCGMIPTRGMTITKMFAIAQQITGKKYKRGGHDAAITDLTAWIEAAKASMPIIDERT
jgi:hypothetical protein